MKILVCCALLPIMFAMFAGLCSCFNDNKDTTARTCKLLNMIARLFLAKAEKQVQKIK